MRQPSAALAIGASLLAACASGPAATPDDRSPETTYPGRCSLVSLEVLDQPATARGVSPPDLGTGSIQLVARYRPGAHSETQKPLAFVFQVRQESVDALEAHLQQHPDVVCGRESAAGQAERYRLDVPPFTDDQGNPISPVQIGDADDEGAAD